MKDQYLKEWNDLYKKYGLKLTAVYNTFGSYVESRTKGCYSYQSVCHLLKGRYGF